MVPMLRLCSLTAENYKSLRQFRLEPKELTIFLGANGVGKSNIFDAFRFIKDRVELRRGFEDAIKARQGMEFCVWQGVSEGPRNFLLRAEFDPPAQYSLGGTVSEGSIARHERRNSDRARCGI